VVEEESTVLVAEDSMLWSWASVWAMAAFSGSWEGTPVAAKGADMAAMVFWLLFLFVGMLTFEEVVNEVLLLLQSVLVE
jgi:hypothetical protein